MQEKTIKPPVSTERFSVHSEACSIQELAHFWDTHDLTDFDDQLEEVKEPVFEQIYGIDQGMGS